MNNIIINKRVEWIDNVKGLAILFVLWGHVQLASPLKNWVTLWHVPIFAVVSGYLFTIKRLEQTPRKSTLSLFKRNAGAYVAFSLISIGVQIVFDTYRYREITTVMINFARNTYASLTFAGIGPLWYIPPFIAAVYCSRILWKKYYLYLGVIIIFLIGAWLCPMLSSGNSIWINTVIYNPMLFVARSSMLSLFMLWGRIISYLTQKINKKQNLAIAITCVFISSVFAYSGNENNCAMLNFDDSICIWLLSSMFATYGIINLFAILVNRRTIFTWFGQESLWLLCTHMTLMIYAVSVKVAGLFIVPPSQLSSMYYLYGLFEVIIMIIIEIPIIKIIHRVSEKWEKAKRKAVKR